MNELQDPRDAAPRQEGCAESNGGAAGTSQEEGAAPAGPVAVERTPEEEFLASVLAGRDLSDLVDPEAERAAEEARIAALSPEERIAHFEHQALETVFDDIRLRSRGGELTTSDYWESVGLVPEHLEPAAFTALVFDTIIEAQARSEESRQAEAEAAEAAQTADAQGEAAAPAERAGENSAPEAAEPTAAEAAPVAEAAVASAAVSVAPAAWDLDDIAVLEGSQVYLYSSREMSDAFARWAFMAAEDDDVATLVENARTESKLYPRPLKADSLKNRPLYLTDERIEAAFAAVQESGQYPDIATCSASNGDVYFYSTDYLSDAQAKALAEWESVERRANM